MARAIPDDVTAMLGIAPDVLPCNTTILFIDMAACIIERALPCITAKGISGDCLVLAEGLLAAHLLSTSGAGQSQGVGIKKRETFENWTIEWAVNSISQGGIMGSTYGQNANSMLGGCLTDLDKPTASITFAGGAGGCGWCC